MTQGAKLYLPMALAVALAACSEPAVRAVYEPDTRVVSRLDADADRDGRPESRTYFAEGRPIRMEVDSDADGTVDRWEYYDETGQLLRLGTSSQRDAIEDTWMVPSAGGARVDISTRRDGIIDRREFQQDGALVRTEQDTNQDGVVDQWARYAGGVMRELLIDTTMSGGRGDQRLVYGDSGLVRVELDTDGDGQFEIARETNGEP